ncbi:MAG: hypothetical protein ABW352_02405 [Polyangiales bacterium]
MVGKLSGTNPSVPPGAHPVFSSRPPPIANADDVKKADKVDKVEPPPATVKLSGHVMMLSRLFKTTDPAAEPEVKTDAKTELAPDTDDVYPFLQQEDRNTLAKAYDFATERGIDPSTVDAVARDIAVHRSSSISPELLEPMEREVGVSSGKAELARAVTAYRLMPGSPETRERYANTTSRMLQAHLQSGGTVDFEYVRSLLTQPK